jgi:hypothetical protein
MKSRLSSLVFCLLLGACASPPKPVPVSAPPVKCDPVVIATPVQAPPPSDIEGLLAYQQSLHQMTSDDLVQELVDLNGKRTTPRVAVQKAMVLALTHGSNDLDRAQAYLAGVLNSADPSAQPLKPLARALAANDADLQRLGQQLDKSNQQLKESQRRIEQLSGMLESLKAIERTLPVRPSALKPPVAK